MCGSVFGGGGDNPHRGLFVPQAALLSLQAELPPMFFII